MNPIFTYLFILIFTVPLTAAVFNYPAHLINIPIFDETYRSGQIEFTSSSAFATGSQYDFDTMFNYAITDRIIIGTTLINSSNFVGNVHCNFVKLNLLDGIGLAGGLQNMTQNTTLSSWDDFPSTEDTSFSPYLVSTTTFKMFRIHTGIGGKRFREPETNNRDLGGIFYGIDIDALFGKIAYEFDGRDSNFGYLFSFSPTWHLYFALTELSNDGDFNPSYNNAPRRFFSFGFSLKENISDFYYNRKKVINKKIKNMDKIALDYEKRYYELSNNFDALVQKYLTKLSELEANKQTLKKEVTALKSALKFDQKYLYNQNKEIQEEKRKKYLENRGEVAEKVLKLYYDAFESYYQENYRSAIESLNTAIVLDPYFPPLYVRLGSIFYELGMNEEALDNWNHAIELDPYNKELVELRDQVQSVLKIPPKVTN